MAERTAVVKIRHPRFEKKLVKAKKANRESLLEHFRYCFSVSSLHGLNHIVWSNRSPFERLFWICAVVGLMFFGILKGYDVFQHYLERPCVISVEMDYKSWLNEFPSFTLCMKELDERALASRNAENGTEMYEYLNDLAFADYTNYHKYRPYAEGTKKEFLMPEQYLDTLLEIVPALQNNTDSKEKNNIFPYNQERPIPKIATEIGICSTLNPSNGIYYTTGYHNSSAKYNHEPIYYDYQFTMLKFECRNFSHNFKATLHSADEIIDITTKMYHLKNTTVTIFTASSVAVVTPDTVKSLSIHQRKCKLSSEAQDLDHSPMYSYNLCRMECRIKLCLKYCNCTPYYYRRNSGEKICNMTGMYCLSNYKDELINLYDKTEEKSICNCLQSCDINTVVVEDVTSSPWFKDSRVTIQILEPPSLRYVRKLIFSRIDLLVQVGGILGLCLGCTILGIVELVYFMTLRFYWGVVKGKAIKSAL